MPSVRRLAALLAADVAGYSRLMGTDEEGTLEPWGTSNFEGPSVCRLSPLEGTGFEPSVPRKATVVFVSILVRADFPSRRIKQRRMRPSRTLVVSRSTDGSNPVPSSGESANPRSLSSEVLAYAWEKLRLSELGGDPAVTALIDSRGKLIKGQIGERLRSGMAAPQGSHRKWDREFESGLLQRTVRISRDIPSYVEKPGFSRGCAGRSR
jgi:hypothetical protein